MTNFNLEGSIVLEKIASIGKLDEFMNAIDSDDFDRIVLLMRKAQLDKETINAVLKEMQDS